MKRNGRVYTTQRVVNLPTEDIEWYDKEYGRIPLSIVLAMLLHNFRSIHRDTGVTPMRVAKDAAKELKESIEEGILDMTKES
jgi:hypothetical protein